MMNITQKKKCGGCRALQKSTWSCLLNYKVGKPIIRNGVILDFEPSEPCPKPLSVGDYMLARKTLMK